MRVIWLPQPKQRIALGVDVYELLYGGARGGGKTDAGIAWIIKDSYINNSKFRGLVIRRNADDLSDWIDRADALFKYFGGVKKGQPAEFVFPSGAKIKTGHLKDPDTYTKYQGHEYQRMLIEEITQIPDELRYEQLIGSCRSTVPELLPSIFMTTNPTGKGHAWVKRRFIKGDGVPKPMKIWLPEKTKRPRVFIPASVYDNPILLENDPGYLDYLKGLPLALREAWLKGSWDVGAGQYFDEWTPEVHVCKPFEIPAHWQRFVCGDYGYSNPSAIYWCAVDPEKSKVYIYRELYVTKHTGEMLAQSIVRMTEYNEMIDWIVMDSSIKDTGIEGGKTVYDQMCDVFEAKKWDVTLRLATKGAGSRINGWNLMRGYLKIQHDVNGYPITRLQVFDNCKEMMRVMPDQMHDENNIEDLDSDGEDHAPDAIRYGLRTLNEPFERQINRKIPQVNKTLTNEQLYQKLFSDR